MPRDNISVVIVGGGISGIAQGIRLKEQLGNKVKITILEKRASPGGIWRDSKWPGAGVDVPIHLYSLYSDLSPEWDQYYASQPEVLAYWLGLVQKYGLANNFLFNTEFVGSDWSSDAQAHTVHTRNSETGATTDLVANVLISAAGPLAKPIIPKIPGLESFKGPYFHNLRWDTSVKLEGKKIAVVGNGSSGVQLVPGVAALPGVQLTHYIRSGGYFFPKLQRQYSTFEKFAFRWIPGAIHAYRFKLLLDHDRNWAVKTHHNDPGRLETEQRLQKYLEDTAPPEYVEALTPHYPLGAKRPAFDLGWLESLHRDNVTLVSDKITQVDETGIITADGVHHDHDVIIWATGSDVPNHGLGVNVNVHGEDGLELQSYWKSIGGPEAYAGLAVPRFPNYFIIIGPNATAGSWGWTLGRQSTAIARIVRELVDYDISSIQPTEEAYNKWNAQVRDALKDSTSHSNATENWWRNAESGKITVTNPKRGIQLWLDTIRTNWSAWDAVRQVPDTKAANGSANGYSNGVANGSAKSNGSAKTNGSANGFAKASNKHLVRVDVLKIQHRRRVLKAIRLAALTGVLAALYWYIPVWTPLVSDHLPAQWVEWLRGLRA